MMKMSRIAAALSLVALFVGSAVVSAAPKEPKDAKCPVSGKACNPAKHADFAGGKVYFCCDNCAGAFKGDSAKFSAKAHQQMVSTGQLTQKCCPLSGGATKPETKLAVGDAEVTFCCNNCKGKVEKASDEEKVKLVFGSDKNAFEAVKK
ncbi:MAG: hypothetical protein DWH87_01925 [Planctomycetota bacterium]|nr:MAG: hypothetical protein DWH87_01925 [Planctomycetota bacterium]